MPEEAGGLAGGRRRTCGGPIGGRRTSDVGRRTSEDFPEDCPRTLEDLSENDGGSRMKLEDLSSACLETSELVLCWS